MGWSIGYDTTWERDIGYSVPAYCDHPDCNETIDRGLGYVCCDQQPYGGEDGCGLYFCAKHHNWRGQCERCAAWNLVCKDCGEDADEIDDGFACPICEERVAEPNDGPESFDPKPEHPRWARHVLTHESWATWRSENPKRVAEFEAIAAAQRSEDE